MFCLRSSRNSFWRRWRSMRFVSSRTRTCSASSTDECNNPWIPKSRVLLSYATGCPVSAWSNSSGHPRTCLLIKRCPTLEKSRLSRSYYLMWLDWMGATVAYCSIRIPIFLSISFKSNHRRRTWGLRRFCVKDFFCLHGHYFFNADRRKSSVENDRVCPCLETCQSHSVSSSNIGPIHCILMYLPRLLVSSQSWLCKIELFLFVIIRIQRIYDWE